MRDYGKERNEILKKASILETEIRSLKIFCELLEKGDIKSMGKSVYKPLMLFNRIGQYFFGGEKYSDNIQKILIPDTMRSEIYTIADRWIKELENEANKLLKISDEN